MSSNSKVINISNDVRAQRIMVKSTQKSDRSWSAIFCVFFYWMETTSICLTVNNHISSLFFRNILENTQNMFNLHNMVDVGHKFRRQVQTSQNISQENLWNVSHNNITKRNTSLLSTYTVLACSPIVCLLYERWHYDYRFSLLSVAIFLSCFCERQWYMVPRHLFPDIVMTFKTLKQLTLQTHSRKLKMNLTKRLQRQLQW